MEGPFGLKVQLWFMAKDEGLSLDDLDARKNAKGIGNSLKTCFQGLMFSAGITVEDLKKVSRRILGDPEDEWTRNRNKAKDLRPFPVASPRVVVTTLNALFIDKAGRKPLLLVSATGMALGCLLAATSFYMKTYQIALAAAPALAVTGILLYIAGYSLGMGAVPWVIMSEIFSIDIKGAAGGLVTLVNWAGAWAVSYTFSFLFTWSSYGTFLLYAAVNVACILFVIKLVPETKRQTLEQRQAGINH